MKEEKEREREGGREGGRKKEVSCISIPNNELYERETKETSHFPLNQTE